MKKIILVDGNSLMFRAYYATAYSGAVMRNKDGFYTNAIFAFANIMSKLESEEKSHIFVAFDAGSKTIRHQEYDDYKGTRKPLPDELLMQIPSIKEYLDILEIKHFEMDDYEADDLIATVALWAEKAKFDEVKIISGDKDLLQLVRGNVSVYLTKKGISELDEYNDDNFYEKMKIYPYQVTDFKGLVGDSSDNLPGIKGIGEVSAIRLLDEFKTLENIIANTSLLKGRQQQLIVEGSEVGLKCKKLATLIDNITLDFSISDLEVKDYDPYNLISFYQEMGFNSLVSRVNVQNRKQILTEVSFASNNYDFSQFREASILAYIEGKDYNSLKIAGTLVLADTGSVFVPYNTMLVSDTFKAFLASETPKLIFDYKKHLTAFAKFGFKLKGVVFDTLLAAYIHNPDQASEDFKIVVDHFIANDLVHDNELANKKKVLSLEVIASQLLKKATLNKELKTILELDLINNEQLELFKIEMKLSEVLALMEENGLLLNKANLQEIETELLAKQSVLIEEIYSLAGEEFNINSPKQLAVILFEKLGLPSGKKNKTGYSTAVDVLEKLAPNYSIVAKILEYRQITKLITTYINGLFEVMNDEDFIHPLYKQALTVTGRLSSVGPNIQNMPIRAQQGKIIRKAFISRFPHGKIMSSDYSQIELRILAHLSQDEVMIDMFNRNVDIHRETAAEMYDLAYEDVSPEERATAKAINFGIIYGISSWGLANNVGIEPVQAEHFIAKYFATFPQVKNYLDNVVREAHQNAYTKTILNRIRYIPELSSDNKAIVAFGERTAMNSPIQGSAADLIKLAMINIAPEMTSLKSKMIAQVHDELVFDVYPGEEEVLKNLVKTKMESALKLDVKLKVDIGFGLSWLETQEE